MNKMMTVAVLAFAACVAFADGQEKVEKDTPHMQVNVKSPLGKRVDKIGRDLTVAQIEAWNRDAQLFICLTNLAARVEVLEAAESNRVARAEKARKSWEERKAKVEGKQDNRQVLRNAIRRGKKVEKGGK